MNQKMLFWILIGLLMNVTQQVDDNNQTYCYTIPSSYCALCGCYQKGRTQHNTLSCGENEVIRMEPGGNLMKVKWWFQTSCDLIIDTVCMSGFSGTDVVTTYDDRLAVYKLCTLQNTCTFTVKPVFEDGRDAKLVRYPYVCEKNYLSMSNPVSLQVTNPVLYFTGKDHVGENINCGCTVTPSDQQTMELDIFYINGDNMCNGVTFNSLDVIQCDNNNTQLYTDKIQVDDDVLSITIKDITATSDDVLYFKVHGNNVRVICSGCLQNTASMKGYISKEEFEGKLNETYFIFGGIIAALIIVSLLGIGIYCCIRRRNTTDKLSNTPNQPVSTDTQYAHADFHPGTESSHYHGLNMYLTVTG